MKGQTQGRRQSSTTEHFCVGYKTRGNRIKCSWGRGILERKEVGQIASGGMQTFLFSLPSYLWALGLCLLTPALWPCTGPTAPQRRTKYTATGNITGMELLGDLGRGSSNWAGAEGRSFLKDNNIMTLLRHSNLALPNWALQTVLHQLWICVWRCVGWRVGWVSAPKLWVSSLNVLINVTQINILP